MAVSVAAALLLGAVFVGDSVWTALAALLVAGGWGALALAGRAPLPGGGGVLVGLLLATAAWSGLSIAWSVAPDLSWVELNRTLVYVAFLAVGLLLGAGPREPAKLAAAALTLAFGAGVVWALAGKAIPAIFPDGGRAARLRDPIGYWNALALAADALLVLALSFAASARALSVRMGCAVLAYAAVVAVFLAASRAGVAAAVLGAVLWLWLRRDRVEAALLALVAIVPAAAVAGWAFTRPALVDDGASHADRVADGAWFGLLLVVGGALVAIGTRELARRPLSPARRRRVARLLRGFAFAVAFVTVVGLVANAGRIADEFRGEEVRNDPGRFASLSSNNRLGVVGGGARHLRGRPARRRRCEHVRGGEEALPRDRLLGDPAAQRPAPVPGRDRGDRARPSARARRCSGGGGRRRGTSSRGLGTRRGRSARSCARALARARARRLRLGLRRGHRPRVLRGRRSRSGRTAATPRDVPARRGRGGCARDRGRRLRRHALARGPERPRRQPRARARRRRRGARRRRACPFTESALARAAARARSRRGGRGRRGRRARRLPAGGGGSSPTTRSPGTSSASTSSTSATAAPPTFT